MSICGDTRGVSEVTGVLILFAFLIVAFSTYQAVSVPAQNSGVEFDHSQQVQGELQEVRNAIWRAGAIGTDQPASVTLGTRYSNRIFAVNPGPVSGELRTVGDEDWQIEIENAVATDEDVAKFWDGDSKTFSTRGLAYEPSYNYQDRVTTRYEHSVLYDRIDDDRSLVLAEQALIDGDRLTFVALDGTLSESGTRRVSIDAKAKSASSRTISITGDGGDDIFLRMPTELSEEQWEELLEGEIDPSDVDVDDETLEITLDGDSTYKLRMAKVGVGSGASDESPAYVTKVGGGSPMVVGQKQELVVEVRDRYNNPVSNVEVSGESYEVGSLSSTSEQRTDEEGRASFVYDADESGTAEVIARIGTEHDYEEITFEFDVSATAAGDAEGPRTANVQASEQSVTPGEPFELNATVSSYERSGTAIHSAEWYREAPDGEIVPVGADEDVGSGYSMDVERGEEGDGDYHAFVGNTSIDTSGWVGGEHTLYVRGEDATGTWGDAESTTIEVVTEPALSVEIDGLDDQSETHDYQPEVTVEESDDIEAENVTVELTITNSTGSVVFEDRKEDIGTLQDDSVQRSFDVGTLTPDTYEYVVIADADNADSAEEIGSFEVSEIDPGNPHLQIEDIRDLDDQNSEYDYRPEIDVSESNDVEAENVEVRLVVTNELGNEVFNETNESIGNLNGESASVDFDVGQLPGDEYAYEVTVVADNADEVSETGYLTVSWIAFFAVDDFTAPITADQGATITATAEITNTGDEESTQTIEYIFDGDVEDTSSLTLTGGQTEEVEFIYELPNSPGTYEHGIHSEDDGETAEITIANHPVLEITDVRDLETQNEGYDYQPEVDVYEVNDEETDVDVSLTITDDSGSGTTVYERTIENIGPLQNSGETVIFEDVGQLDPDEYEYEITATGGQQVDPVTETGSFSVVETGSQADEVTVGNAVTHGQAQARITFDIRNTGSDSVVLTGITVDSTSTDATGVHFSTGAEFIRTSNGETLLDQTIQIPSPSTYQLQNDLEIPQGELRQVTLREFRRGNSYQNRVNMQGETVTLTLYFSDGSSSTVTMTAS